MHQKAILNTWKEIAQYVGRSVRTIQRWERELNFPIHRPRGKQRSAVLAVPSEIDEWARNTPFMTSLPGHTNVTVLDPEKWRQEQQRIADAAKNKEQAPERSRAPRTRARPAD